MNLPESNRSPSLAQVIKQGIAARLQSLHTAIPAKVETYDATTQKADVKPLLQTHYYDEEGKLQSEALPVITSVPVVFPAGGGFRMLFPVSPGDTVLLVFSERSLDKWLQQGGGPLDPGFTHTHALSDAIAIPGLHPFSTPHAGANASGVTMGKDGGPQVLVTAAGVELGGTLAAPATDPVPRGTALNAAINNFATAVAVAINGMGAAGPSNPVLGGAATAAGTAITTAATALSAALTAALSLVTKTK
jgi:hypothetical protein